MATSAYLNQAYLAYFGRPVDVNGATAFSSATNEQVQAAFYASAESQALYGTTVDANFINNVYLNVLGRAAEPAGITYWLSQISKGLVTPAGAAIAILNGAQGSDVTTVNNKLTAAAAFTAALDTTAEMIGYSGTTAAASARAFLATVTSTAATSAAIDAAVVSATTGGAVGSTYTLTTGQDVFNGNAGADILRGVAGAAVGQQDQRAGPAPAAGVGYQDRRASARGTHQSRRYRLMKRHNFFLPDEIVAELKAVAIETGVPMSELVRRALSTWLTERKAKVPA